MGYINVLEHSGQGRHINVDQSPIFEDLYNLELGFMDIYVTSVFSFLLQLHRVFGCTHTAHYVFQWTIEC